MKAVKLETFPANGFVELPAGGGGNSFTDPEVRVCCFEIAPPPPPPLLDLLVVAAPFDPRLWPNKLDRMFIDCGWFGFLSGAAVGAADSFGGGGLGGGGFFALTFCCVGKNCPLPVAGWLDVLLVESNAQKSQSVVGV